MLLRLIPFVSLGALALDATATAQDINIADANAVFTKDFETDGTQIFPTGATVDFLRADPNGDAAGALFKSAWIYREASDTREFMFNDGAGQASYNNAGNVGTATWADMDGRGLFSATVTYTVTSTGPDSGVVVCENTITNISGNPLTLTLFHFADFDLCGAAFDQNSSTSGENRRQFHTSTCGETAEHYARLPDRWETQTSGNLYSRFENTSVDDLLNNTGNVGPGDVRSSWEWENVTLAAGASTTLVVQMSHNIGTPEVVINEFSYDDSSTDDLQYVELFNASPFAAEIGGWILESEDPSGPNFSTPITAGVTLAPGEYYVLGDTNVPNVDQPIGANPENSEESLTLKTPQGVIVDSLVYEAWRGIWNPAVVEGEGVWGNNTLIEGPDAMSLSRYRDGRDTDNNGNDFGVMPWSPGTTNNQPDHSAFSDNFDTTAPGTPIAGWQGAFTPLRAIDPTVVDTINPNAIAASPQGGNAAIMWDESGGGNMNVLVRAPGIETSFEAYVYIDSTPLDPNLPEHEVWSIGIQGTTGTFHNSPNPPNQAGWEANGDTGVAWIYRSDETGVNVYLVDVNDGGWGAGAVTPPTILATIPVTSGTNDGWQRMSLDITGTTLTARFGGTLGQPDGQLFSATVAPNLAGVYLGYREFIANNALARPLTLDAMSISFCTQAEVSFFGLPTANTVGTPMIDANPPVLGGTMTISCSGLLPNSNAAVLLGIALTTPLDLTPFGGVPGSMVYVDGWDAPVFSTSTTGTASNTLIVPNDRSLCGAPLASQWVQVDNALPVSLPISLSGAMTTTVGL